MILLVKYDILHNFTTDACKGYRAVIYCFIFFTFFNAGTTFACFQSLCISPDFSYFEKMDVKIGATCLFNSFNTLPCILSGPHALCGFRLHRSFDTPVDDMFICGFLE